MIRIGRADATLTWFIMGTTPHRIVSGPDLKSVIAAWRWVARINFYPVESSET